MPKIRNIIIFVSIAVVLFLIYFFFIRQPSEPAGLVVTSPTPTTTGTAPLAGDNGATPFIAKDFLTLLLNVKTIKLDDSIYANPAFASLHDSSIILVPDGTEGRPNPFAQFGADTNFVPPAGTP